MTTAFQPWSLDIFIHFLIRAGSAPFRSLAESNNCSQALQKIV